MKSLITVLTLGANISAYSQSCQIDMVDSYNQVVRSYNSYDANSGCVDSLKECRKAIRLEPQLGGVDCLRVERPTPTPAPGPHYPDVTRMDIIDQAANFALEGCYVLKNVDGWANQIYINGVFKGNYDSIRQVGTLRDVLMNNQYQGRCRLKSPMTLDIQFRPNLIQDAVNYELSSNCYVKPLVDGWANQMYVNGIFKGNYDSRTHVGQMTLRVALAGNLTNGVCRPRSAMELSYMRDPYLVSDFANFRYPGCHVRMDVGQYHQVYVGNTFKGNYDKVKEYLKLKNYLVNLLIQGQCRY